MNKLIDTHSHLYSGRFTNDLSETIDRAKAVCSHIFLPNIDLESVEGMHALCDNYSDTFFAMMGLHPCHAFADWKEVNKKMEKAFGERKYYGVGETGLDYHWDKTFIPQQKDSLRMHIEWAKDMDLPLILHCRESMDDVIELVNEGQNGNLQGIFHCFNGNAEQATKILDLGFMTGLGGVITYKSAQNLRDVVKDIPLSSIVLETDSPYLPPVPFRGKRNESSYVRYVAEKIAEIKDVPLSEIAKTTSDNALRMFGV